MIFKEREKKKYQHPCLREWKEIFSIQHMAMQKYMAAVGFKLDLLTFHSIPLYNYSFNLKNMPAEKSCAASGSRQDIELYTRRFPITTGMQHDFSRAIF